MTPTEHNLHPAEHRSEPQSASPYLSLTDDVYRALIENSTEAIAIISAQGNCLYATPSTENILGYAGNEVLAQNFFSLTHNADIPALKKILQSAGSKPGKPVKSAPIRMRHKDGSWRWIESTITDMTGFPSINGFINNFRDVGKNKLAEEKLRYANRLYGFISQLNQAIVHIHDQRTLLEKVCRIAMGQGNFKFAWIGILDKQSRRMELISSCDATKDDLDFFEDYSYESNGPIEKVLHGLDYYMVSDIEKREENPFIAFANKRGFKSVICLALRKSGETIGTFNLYSAEKHFFSPEEIALLKEATADLSFALDILDKEALRAQAEENLRHSQYRLKQSQAIAHLGSWDVDLTTGIAVWSEEMLRIYGLEPEDAIQSYKSWMSFVHPEDVTHVKDIIAHAEETKTAKITAFHHRIVLRSGAIRYIHCQAQYQYDHTGVATGLYGVAHDVTETKTAELAMRQSQKNLRLIVDSIPQCVFVKDYEGKYLFVNKNFADLFGMQPKEMIRRTLSELLPGHKEESVLLAYDREVMQKGMPKTITDFQFTDANGTPRIFQIVKMPYTTAGKSVKSILGIALDVTEQRHSDAERSQMIDDIVQRNKDLEQFSYIVSHNLRAPVANIIGLTRELGSGNHDDRTNEMLTRELSTSAKQIDTIIIDLNNILRAREIHEKSEKIELQGLIDEIRFSIRDIIRREEVSIKTNFSQENELITVKSYLHSILYNLISNGIKFHRPNVPPVIEIKTLKSAGKLQICITDNGSGIDLANKKKQVFGLYKRFHPHIEGKGMGLFMVKTQVETLGGEISIKSKINQGTTFAITFPN